MGTNKQTKILIVEGETPLALHMISVLSHFNCDVDWAHRGKKAMELATQKRFDLIILDIEMPDMPGLEICAELRQRHISYKTPIILLSATATPENLAEAKRRGGTDCLVKPMDVTELVYKVIYYARAQNLTGQESQGMLA
jgi:DNA-binding response OmpR family regulator